MLKLINCAVILAVTLAASIACTEQNTATDTCKISVVSFTASAPEPGEDISDLTKTSLDLKTGKASWIEGDQIRIYWGVSETDNATATAQNSGQTTVFVTDTEIPNDKAGYWAIYPATQNATLSSGKLNPDFSQTNRPANFESAAIATAYTFRAGGNLDFKNACALVSFTTDKSNLYEVKLTADGLVGGTSNKVSMYLANAAALSSQTTGYYIPIAPSSAVKEFTLRLKTKKGEDLPAYHNAEDRVFNASKLLSLGNIDNRIESTNVSGKGSFRLMSFNILRGDLNSKNENCWDNRRDAVMAMLQTNAPDILGLQECNSEQRNQILDEFPEYAAVGISVKGDAVSQYRNVSSNPILYRSKYFKMEDWGTFWLSDTPETASNTWYYDKPRTATWALLRINGTDAKFIYINTHLQDNNSSILDEYVGKETEKGSECRDKQMEVILEKLSDINTKGYPVLLAGDFNSAVIKEKFLWFTTYHPCFEELMEIMSDASKTAPDTDEGRTLNSFGTTATSVIDHIFHTNKFKVTTFKVDRNAYSGVTYISDHYPVYADLSLDTSFNSSLGDWSVDEI